MTVEWFDLAGRMHAAATGRVTARLAHAPAPRPDWPVAVSARRARQGVTVTAATREHPPRTAIDGDGLALLHDLGVRITVGGPRTLVVADTHTLPALVALAHTTPRAGGRADTAAAIAFWADRADFPGTGVHLHLPATCQTRWVTGEPPTAERDIATWRAWLGVTDDTPAGLVTLADHVTAGPRLPTSAAVVRDDARAWHRARDDHANGANWAVADTRARAALGLRARCDTADLHQSGLLDDPLARRREVHTGTIVTGTAHPHTGRRAGLTVTCDRMDARLRAGNHVHGWAGEPDDGQSGWNATVADVQARGGALTVTLTAPRLDPRAHLPTAGERVTLRPAPTDPGMQNRGRGRYGTLYGRRGSWLSTGGRPTTTRRDVPLDVAIAAAEE